MKHLHYIIKMQRFLSGSGRVAFSLYGMICKFFLLFSLAILCSCENVMDDLKEYNTYLDIAAVTPAVNALNVSINSDITVQFSDDIDMSTVNASTFSVNGGAVAGVFSYDALLRTVVFNPDVNFSYNSVYSVTLTKGIKNLSGNYLNSDYTWYFTTKARLSVVSVTPADGAALVPVNSVGRVEFSDEMDITTISPATGSILDSSLNHLPGTISIDSSLRIVTYTPAANLSNSTVYTVLLTTGMRSTSGDSLASDYSWSFKTIPLYALSVNTVTPVNGATNVSAATYIYAEFNKSINIATVNSSTFTVKNGAVTIPGTYSYDLSLNRIKFIPDAILTDNTTLTITLTSGIEDFSGDIMASDFIWSFTTAPAHYIGVVSVFPASGATGISPNTLISATFTDDINMSTVTSSTFTVNPGAITGTYSYDAELRTVTFTPASPLPKNATYTVNLTTGIQNTSGDTLASPYSWTFNVPATFNFNVVSVNPLSGATGVPVATTVVAQFDDNIDMDTVTTTTFSVGGGILGSYDIDPLLRTVTFTPDAFLAASTLYNVTITTGLENMSGDKLAANYNWSFTTGIVNYINVLSVYPANGATGVAISTDVVAQFDDNIDMSTVNTSTFSVNGGAGAIAGSYVIDPIWRTVTFTPAADLAYSTLYNVTLTTGIHSIAGDSLAAAYNWSFTTAASAAPEIAVISPIGEILSGGKYLFGNVVVNTTKSAVFTIENNGNYNLTIIDILSDDPAYTISVTPATPFLIGEDGSNLFTINFSPTSTGLKKAFVIISNTDSNESQFTIKVEGTSVSVAAPEIQVTNNGIDLLNNGTVDFGTVNLGQSKTIQLVMRNIGSAALNVSIPAIGGTNPGMFSTDFSGPVSIPVDSSVSFNITFTASSAINARATISFANDDSDENPFVIKLKGKGR